MDVPAVAKHGIIQTEAYLHAMEQAREAQHLLVVDAALKGAEHLDQDALGRSETLINWVGAAAAAAAAAKSFRGHAASVHDRFALCSPCTCFGVSPVPTDGPPKACQW